MLIALSLIFIGIKRHRDQNLGGVIKFGPAFGLGLAIAAVAGVFYVAGWEAYLASTDYAFINDYTDGLIEKKKAEGVTGEELQKIVENMEAMVKNYANNYVFRNLSRRPHHRAHFRADPAQFEGVSGALGEPWNCVSGGAANRAAVFRCRKYTIPSGGTAPLIPSSFET